MNFKILSFDEVYQNLWMADSFRKRVEGLSDDEKKAAIRQELTWPDGFLDKLRGLPLAEQINYYGISETAHTGRTAYGKITRESRRSCDYALADYPYLKALIVEDGVLIGAGIQTYNNHCDWGTPVFPYQDVCTYIAIDNDGAGTDEREDYAHLFCLMPE